MVQPNQLLTRRLWTPPSSAVNHFLWHNPVDKIAFVYPAS